MPDDLLDTDWAAVTHAYGPATDLPGLLDRLRHPEESVREAAASRIRDRVAHQGSSYPAGAALAPHLIALFADDTAPDRTQAHDLLAILLPEGVGPAVHRRHPLGPRLRDLAEERSNRYLARLLDDPPHFVVEPEQQAVFDAVRAGVPTFLRLLDNDDRDARGYSAHLLSHFPGLGDRIAPALTARLAVEQDSVVGAILCLTAGFVGDPADAELRQQVVRRRDHPRAVTRWTVLMGLARLAETPDTDLLKELCDCLFDIVEPLEGWPFHHGHMAAAAAETLSTLPVRAVPQLADLLLGRLRLGGDDATRFFYALPLVLSALFPDGPLPEGADLDPDQRAAVQVVLNSGLAEHPFVSRALEECGLTRPAA